VVRIGIFVQANAIHAEQFTPQVGWLQMLDYAFTDRDLIVSFGNTPVARRQYEVFFVGDNNAHMMVWADNKIEAKDIAREYAARILNRKFRFITIGA
jgi:hypothetical protein